MHLNSPFAHQIAARRSCRRYRLGAIYLYFSIVRILTVRFLWKPSLFSATHCRKHYNRSHHRFSEKKVHTFAKK